MRRSAGTNVPRKSWPLLRLMRHLPREVPQETQGDTPARTGQTDLRPEHGRCATRVPAGRVQALVLALPELRSWLDTVTNAD